MSSIKTELAVAKRGCRACMTTELTTYLSLHADNSLLEKYEYAVDIKVNTDDTDPPNVCMDCVGKIYNFADFKLTCNRSDAFWKSLSRKNVLKDVQPSADDKYLLSEVVVKIKTEDEYDICEENAVDNNEDVFASSVHEWKLNNESSNDKHSIGNEVVASATDVKAGDRKAKLFGRNSKNKIRNCRLVTVKGPVKKFSGQCDRCKRKFSYRKPMIRHLEKANCKRRKLPKCTSNRKQDENYKSQVLPRRRICALLCGLCDFKGSDLEDVNRHLQERHASQDLLCAICDFKPIDLAAFYGHRFKHQPDDSDTVVVCHEARCGRKFLAADRLEFHYRGQHMKVPAGLCAVCGKKFTSFKSWRSHVRLHTSWRYECDHCGRRYHMKSDIIAHIEEYSRKNMYMCHMCGYSSHRLRSVKNHEQCMHKKHTSITCQTCRKSFKHETSLKSHVRRMHSDKKHFCAVCGDGFAYQQLLRSHMVAHSEERTFPCHVCGTCYKRKSHLRQHVLSHADVKRYKCSLCEKSFITSVSLRRHGAVHTGVRRYSCQHCSRSFNTNRLLDTHMQSHYKSWYRSEFISHLREHSNRKDFICDICGFSTKRKSNLTVHLETQHYVVGNLPCEICGKTFKSKGTHSTHVRRFHGVMRETCEYCGKRFTSPVPLQRHLIWHRDARPFQCGLCDRAYKMKQQLNVHYRSHTGERPYECDVCRSAFAVPSGLKRHKRCMHSRVALKVERDP